MKKVFLAIFVAVFLAAGPFSTVVAGEITGNGKWIAGSEDAPLKGKSECAYSGREDEPDDPTFKGTMAQAWGLMSKELRDFLTSIGFAPGDACNPAKNAGG